MKIFLPLMFRRLRYNLSVGFNWRYFYSPQIEVSYPGKRGCPAYIGKARGGKFRHYYIVHAVGAMTNQELPRLVPAHNQANVGSVRVQGKIPWQGLRL